MKYLFHTLLALLSVIAIQAMTPEARRSYEAFERKAESGDPEAMYRLSALLERGFDTIPADTARSVSLLKRSAHAGFAPAMNYLGFLYQTGFPPASRRFIAVDRDSALIWMRGAADLGDAKAAHNLAYLILSSSEDKKTDSGPEDSLAVAYLSRAAEAGLPQSMTLLADLYARGKAVPCDTARAVSLYEDAISHGFSDAEARLLNMMLPRWRMYGAGASLSEALRYWNLGAHTAAVTLLRQIGPSEPQTARAYALLGHASSRGLGMPYDHRLANEYFARAALLGDPSACFILAETLEIFPDALSDLLPDLPGSMTPESLRSVAARAGITSAEAAAAAITSPASSRPDTQDATPPAGKYSVPLS